jgi:hypothetical protein
MGTFFYFAAEPNKVFDQKIFAAFAKAFMIHHDQNVCNHLRSNCFGIKYDDE